ncbi:STT3 domain-containing protein [Anaeromyxobacter oryzisoli]|uniref:STT3 domain-containing protein n=1 Tax=Anaeromyxobacter oryzisoli TaxID=2925408 RepID=UPI001F58BDDD|nr:STT3 domain-containing protein [Anaeromyxobacter sp. SG63]
MSFSPARVLAPAAVLILAAATRLTSYDIVYGGERTRLVGDSDPHYHVLRAANWLTGAPGAPWRDPGLSWPDGADIPWPPLFDALVAGAARLVHGATPALDAIAAVAAPLPVLLSLALVLLVAALGRRLGTIGWIAASLVAVLPAASEPGALGRADQHVLEVVLFTAALLLFVAGAAPRRRAPWPAAALALVLTLAFWSWMGSALHLVPLIVAAAAWHLLDDDAAGPGLATLAGGALGAAALLAASVAWLGPPGALASGATTRVGGLHVALLVAAGAGAALVLALRRARRAPASIPRRVAELAAATALPAAALLLVPSLRSGIEGGLVALLAANPWYDRINEFRPILGSGTGSARTSSSCSTATGSPTSPVSPARCSWSRACVKGARSGRPPPSCSSRSPSSSPRRSPAGASGSTRSYRSRSPRSSASRACRSGSCPSSPASCRGSRDRARSGWRSSSRRSRRRFRTCSRHRGSCRRRRRSASSRRERCRSLPGPRRSSPRGRSGTSPATSPTVR